MSEVISPNMFTDINLDNPHIIAAAHGISESFEGYGEDALFFGGVRALREAKIAAIQPVIREAMEKFFDFAIMPHPQFEDIDLDVEEAKLEVATWDSFVEDCVTQKVKDLHEQGFTHPPQMYLNDLRAQIYSDIINERVQVI